MIVSDVGRTTSGFLQLRLRVGDQRAVFIRNQAVMSDDRHFLCKSIDMRCLTFEIGKRYKNREIGILNSGRLDPVVHQALYSFPNAIAPRFDDHASTNARLFGQIGGGDNFLIPVGEIVLAPRVERMTDVRGRVRHL